MNFVDMSDIRQRPTGFPTKCGSGQKTFLPLTEPNYPQTT